MVWIQTRIWTETLLGQCYSFVHCQWATALNTLRMIWIILFLWKNSTHPICMSHVPAFTFIWPFVFENVIAGGYTNLFWIEFYRASFFFFKRPELCWLGTSLFSLNKSSIRAGYSINYLRNFWSPGNDWGSVILVCSHNSSFTYIPFGVMLRRL